jgi:uncharacterized membrane protein YhaH (DUF805 family)
MDDISPLEWAVRPMRKFAVFAGRAPRAEYWWFYLATVIVQIPLTIADQAIGTWSPFSSLFSLATFIPWLAVTVRRLHDTNRSGWWLLTLLIPIFVVGFAAAAAVGATLSGTAPSEPTGSMLVMLIVAVVAMIIVGITMFVFMVSEGTHGRNDYGDDPYGRGNLEEVFA